MSGLASVLTACVRAGLIQREHMFKLSLLYPQSTFRYDCK